MFQQWLWWTTPWAAVSLTSIASFLLPATSFQATSKPFVPAMLMASCGASLPLKGRKLNAMLLAPVTVFPRTRTLSVPCQAEMPEAKLPRLEQFTISTWWLEATLNPARCESLTWTFLILT